MFSPLSHHTLTLFPAIQSFIVNRTGGIDLDCVCGEGSVRIENIPVLSCSTVL